MTVTVRDQPEVVHLGRSPDPSGEASTAANTYQTPSSAVTSIESGESRYWNDSRTATRVTDTVAPSTASSSPIATDPSGDDDPPGEPVDAGDRIGSSVRGSEPVPSPPDGAAQPAIPARAVPATPSTRRRVEGIGYGSCGGR
ncbi:hypothetical protein [Halorarum salinum]|uniref:Uncharacterized protein n=1 Tax=Halorarum salinum TaxID=2743089 RepID=A0A7D5LBG2_9EURY|nr:hypothetical protein [Halobaculum salinum]QLG62571.1 hypothetical protein HUG12_12890 [Halobaculum salinum]